MAKPKVYSGFTADTPEKLLLDAGAYFKNYEVGVDSFDDAVAAGKLIGATSGGGTYSQVPEIRQIPIDGVKGDVKGMSIIDSWKITIMANIKEVSVETIQMSLGAATVEDGPSGYKKITANNYIKDTDYIDNIVWVGRLSGSNNPVIIEILNALSLGGINLNMVDKDEALLATTLTAHYDATDLDTPPAAIYYPDDSVI